jgi:hypothetical protein
MCSCPPKQLTTFTISAKVHVRVFDKAMSYQTVDWYTDLEPWDEDFVRLCRKYGLCVVVL